MLIGCQTEQPITLTTQPTVEQVTPVASATVTNQPSTESSTNVPDKTITTATTINTPSPIPTVTVTLTPTVTSTSVQTKLPTSTIQIYEMMINLPTYPYSDYLVEQLDPVYNLSLFYLNRVEYEAVSPQPREKQYKAVVLENDYLRLTFLPELGGRLYSAVIKQTEQEIFYHNPVVKPSVYGPLSTVDGVNPNWWLATGGMEWAYPVQEHGYRWGVPWTYKTNQTNTEATITLSDVAPDRVGAEVTVTLSADSPIFRIEPRLINQTNQAVPVQFWINAALSLSPGGMSLRNQFIIPAETVIIHSRGADGWDIPGEHEPMSWPTYREQDLTTYQQWANYLGYFIPHLSAPFMGAYNLETDLGVARLITPETVAGNKVFAFSQTFPYRSYTDDDSQYFELWGGVNEGFWPEYDVMVQPGETLSWEEAWWPLAQLGGLSWANQQVALYHYQNNKEHLVTITLAQSMFVELTLLNNGVPIETETVSLQPDDVIERNYPFTEGALQLQITDSQNNELLTYSLD